MFITGRRGYEAIAGFAWAGHIKGGGFRGEVLYSNPRENYDYPEGYVNMSVSGDYTFTNSLYLQSAVLYNRRGTTGGAGGMELINAFIRRDLSSARMSVYGQISKDLSPLVRFNLSGILNPYDHSWYFSPSISWSVLTNLDFSGMGMVFGGDKETEFGDNSELMMARFKWSF